MNDPRNNPYAHLPTPPSPRTEPGAVERQALQLAGVFLLAGAALNAVALLKLHATLVRTTYSSGWIAVLFDLFIGGSLFAGQHARRWWAMMRAILGAALFGIPLLARGQRLDGALVLASCLAIILLVLPNPSPRRVTVASVVYGVTFLVLLVVFARSVGTTRVN
jgi:DNA mismatch repair protein MutH